MGLTQSHQAAKGEAHRIECLGTREAFGLRPIYRRFQENAGRSDGGLPLPGGCKQSGDKSRALQTLARRPQPRFNTKAPLLRR